MSKIDELIQQYCPNGVEYKTLGEVCEILDSKRKPISKSSRTNGDYPYYGANGIQDYVSDYIFDGTFVLIGEDGSVITPNGNPVVNWAEGKIWVNNHAHIIAEKNCCRLRYLFHYLQIIDISNFVHGNIPKLTQGDLRNLSIPVPPLPVQEEIVRILDKFTTLEAELEAELDCRKRQYEYYRSKLLSFNNLTGGGISQQVKWVKMSEIGTFTRGNGIQKKDFVESGVGCIHYGQIHTYYGTFTYKTKSFITAEYARKLKKAAKGDLIIATTSEDIEGVCKAVAWLGDEEIAVSTDAYIFHHNQNPKYISYLFQTEMFREHKKKYATGTKVIRVSGDNMGKFYFPLPPLSEQERIVAILDRFDALVNDISIGLPAEIEARRKQYEYYRNKLLAFPEHKTAA